MAAVPDGLANALQDRYRLDRELGHGGMATVYLAQDLRHHRQVAIKVLRPELAAALGPERFLREITLTAQLTHPHILPLLDSGDVPAEHPEHSEGPRSFLYYVMPYVEGESLRDRLKREKQLPLDDALQITREVADALSYAHAHGVIHRDIKPENILLESGHAVVADFGIARAIAAAGSARLTETGLAVGTPAYMSPEQGMGEAGLDARSDVYALGCVLYEMLAGEPPFTGPTAQAVIAKRLAESPPPISTVRDGVPPGVEAALNKALARTPADRFRTAAEFRDALTADAGSAVSAPRPVARRARIRRLAIGAVALLIIAGGLWTVARRRALAGGSNPNAIPLDSTAIAVLPFQVVGADSASPARTLARFMGDLFELKVTGEFGWRIRYPGSVAQRWREAGGTLDSAMAEQAELSVARAVGAGWLVRGMVVAQQDSIVMSASMVRVPSGVVLVPPVRVEGTVAQQQDLVDQLIVLLLARDRGISAEAAPRLRRYEPEAIQAWLAGNRAPTFEGRDYYRRALALDSSFVLAALQSYAAGEAEADSAELRYAWEHRDHLPERQQAWLQVLAAGRYGDIRTEADKIAAYEALTRRWPEWETPRTEAGGDLEIWGALASVPDWHRRAREALEHVTRPGSYEYWHLTELAFMEEDTARARAATDSLLTRVGKAGWLARRVPAYRWRLAILTGDTAEASRALSRTPDSLLVLAFAKIDARGIAQADRVAAAGGGRRLLADWAWARGRDDDWRAAWQRLARVYGQEVGQTVEVTVPIYRALLLGAAEDTMVVREVQTLEGLAGGAGNPPPSDEDRILARCWTTLWTLRHGDTTGAREMVRYLDQIERPFRYAGWARLFDALLAEAGAGDVRAALLRMDAVVRELPLPTGLEKWWPWPIEVQNLMLAQMLGRHGESHLALAAIRRRPYSGIWGSYYLGFPEYLREEGRLAAAVGDTAGAIRAYRHYLALRDDPDPPWRAPRDSVRAELAALVAR